MSAASVSPDATAVDVAIVGGGMVGASLALGLAGSGMRILLTEAVPFGASGQPSFDERSTALGNASRRIFEGLGVWHGMAPEAAPIRAIHISDAGGFGCARLSAAEQGIEALGYVAPNRRIGAQLWGLLTRAPGLSLRVPGRVEDIAIDAGGARFIVVSGAGREAVTARLIVAADGAHSEVRTAAGIDAGVEDYQQLAVVANVASDTPHEGIAYERFTRSGPLAVLPLADATLSVIWACHRADAPRVLSLDDAAWLGELQSRFGWRAGRFVRAGRRASYPLRLTRALYPVATRTVLIGNAAQALHPVAGQGFNLGLRDAAMLAEVLTSSAGDPGDAALLARFAAWRARDRSGVTRFTDGLVRLFGDQRPGMGLLRNLGLLLFDLSPPAKSALARVSLGFGGPTPRLARGLPVRHA
ncbi:MAG TPA: 2-octaprenyl-6-methoxyphenyl hydroxylase [Steroidobacteraceae bacterium]|jgi:2-octaprenyl-6-methoxyphenol hydroxylase|nr:2-octaprenyl-6-methoxyphenyl hydroxylase [Steroidobacteraceae bacterium]